MLRSLYRKKVFPIIQTIDFWGDLTDKSAKTGTLLFTGSKHADVHVDAAGAEKDTYTFLEWTMSMWMQQCG